MIKTVFPPQGARVRVLTGNYDPGCCAGRPKREKGSLGWQLVNLETECEGLTTL